MVAYVFLIATENPKIWEIKKRTINPADTINSTFNAGSQIVEWKLLLTVFASVFIAEMADKTQVVTMLFAADRDVSKWTVFFGSASALVLTSAIGVVAGTLLAVQAVRGADVLMDHDPQCMNWIAAYRAPGKAGGRVRRSRRRRQPRGD